MALHVGAHLRADLVLEMPGEERQHVRASRLGWRCPGWLGLPGRHGDAERRSHASADREPRTVETALDRLDGRPEYLGDLARGQTLHVAEHEHLAVHRIERADG